MATIAPRAADVLGGRCPAAVDGRRRGALDAAEPADLSQSQDLGGTGDGDCGSTSCRATDVRLSEVEGNVRVPPTFVRTLRGDCHAASPAASSVVPCSTAPNSGAPSEVDSDSDSDSDVDFWKRGLSNHVMSDSAGQSGDSDSPRRGSWRTVGRRFASVFAAAMDEQFYD